ncbi:MAG: hypothetical protein U0736_11695 [Gemmataceae bacterium]
MRSARRMIRSFPDVALEALQTEGINRAGSPAMQEIAATYDQHAGANWAAVLAAAGPRLALLRPGAAAGGGL